MNNTEIKKINRNNILRYMLTVNEISKSSLAMDLRMSIPTVAKILEELAALGLVKEIGEMESVGGRKAMGYICVRDAKCAVGLDITFNHVCAVIVNLAGEVLYSRRYRTRIEDNDESYSTLGRMVSDAVNESGINPESILGVGVSIPAIVQEDGREITGMHEKMRLSLSLYDILKDKITFPLHLQNDANSAARAEFYSVGVDESVIYFFLSQTVGGAIISDSGEIHTGTRMRAGEFGHMTLHPDGRTCYCGRKGCLDAYCNTGILADTAGGRLEDFFARLKQGDSDCRKVWEEYLDDLAISIHNLLMVFDHTVLIGGYLGQFISPYLETLGEKVTGYDPYLKGQKFLRAGKMKYEAAAVGAAIYFIEEFIGRI